MLSGKKILLGITGSIAAYKSAALVRLLVKAGAEVKVVMTPAARDFITPLTLSTLSKHPVISEFTSDSHSGKWNNHVELGMWADIFLIAPASANTIAKMANGVCDNFLLAVYLSAKCPVFVAPAMDLDMYKHKTTRGNIIKLHSFGNIIIDAAFGELASGLIGEGRMEEPEFIVKFLDDYFGKNLPLKNKKVLITAGPTYEPIDPVRFIGNYSSGKMGFALAQEAAAMGADVKLISGPVSLKTSAKNIERIDVSTADEMYDEALKNFPNSDITIMSAAVADFKPIKKEKLKIKKSLKRKAGSGKQLSSPIFHLPSIQLESTKDILLELGKRKKKEQILVGFALETDNEISNAKQKLKNKNLDFIVINSLNDSGAGFQTDTNKITIIDKQNKIEKYELKSKNEVAKDIFKKIEKLLNKRFQYTNLC